MALTQVLASRMEFMGEAMSSMLDMLNVCKIRSRIDNSLH